MINSSDSVVITSPFKNIMLPVQENPAVRSANVPGAFISQVRTAMRVDELISGAPVGQTFSLAYGQEVLGSVNSPLRRQSSGLDLCMSGPVLLFLQRSPEPGGYSVGYDAWARIDRESVQASPKNDLFRAYDNGASLIENIKSVAAWQEATGLPKGRLMCEFNRNLNGTLSSLPCPGDIFNPYEALHLDGVTEKLSVVSDTSQEVPPPLPPQEAADLVETLNVELTLDPNNIADLGNFVVLETRPALFYSPNTHVIAIAGPTGGQFTAPPAFEAAMKPFLATAPAH